MWLVLGTLLISLPIFVPQSEVQQFQEVYWRRAWMFTKPFYPAWFALPQWIFFLWFGGNIVLWTINRSLKFHNKPWRMPYLSIPFLILAIFVIVTYSARNSDYLKKLYAPRDSYILDPATLKLPRNTDTEDDYFAERYEKKAADKPVRSRVKDRLWKVPEEVLNQFTPLSYEYSGGKYKNATINYRLRIPQKLEKGKKYPLMIWLHGVGESGNNNVSQLSHMEPLIPFINGPKQRDFFILATQCPQDNRHWDRSSTKEGKGDAPMTIAMEILDDIIHHYPVDEQAISVFGFSSGGYGVWSMGLEYPGRFAALIPVSCNPHRNVYKFVVNYGTTVWAFNNTGDNSVVFSRIKEEIEQIHNKGGTAYMTTFETKGHDAWRNALLDTPLIDWLMRLQRNPSPYRVPYWITPPERSKNDFFMLFIFPFYLCGLLLFVPIAALVFEKIIEMDARSEKINDEEEDDISDTEIS
jgi:predicted esterase